MQPPSHSGCRSDEVHASSPTRTRTALRIPVGGSQCVTARALWWVCGLFWPPLQYDYVRLYPLPSPPVGDEGSGCTPYCPSSSLVSWWP
eukprot:4766648-Pyramimonas_sp.AAC.2